MDKPHAAQAEVTAIIDVGIAMRALISSCEYFTRSAILKPQILVELFGTYACGGDSFINIAFIFSLYMI